MMKNFILLLLFFVHSHLSAQISLWSDFEDGTLEEWTNTDTSETLLSVENEANFFFLRKECDGSNSPVGEMAIMNTSEEWTGNHWYETGTGDLDLGAVYDIRMRNSNDFDIHIRIGITGSNGFQVVTTTPLIVPALSDWTTYEAPHYWVDWLNLINLTVLNDTSGMTAMEIRAHVIDMFEDVIEYRVIHNNNIAYNGEVVNGFLEIDEMISFWLLSTNETKKKNFVIFPNPADSEFTIESNIQNDYSNLNIKVYDVTGKTLIEKTNINTSNQYLKTTIDVSELTSGVYFYSIGYENNQLFNGRLIKE